MEKVPCRTASLNIAKNANAYFKLSKVVLAEDSVIFLIKREFPVCEDGDESKSKRLRRWTSKA